MLREDFVAKDSEIKKTNSAILEKDIKKKIHTHADKEKDLYE